MKIIIFDVDETLGAFYEFSLYCNKVLGHMKISQQMFNYLLDINPIYLQINILKVLEFVKRNKGENKVVMFTNNQGCALWITYIKTYFHMKLQFPLFDHVILANKYELYRTQEQKTLADFWACTKYPTDSPILFMDDQVHPLMIHPLVTYIKLEPYKTTAYVDISEYLINKIKTFLK